MQSRAVAMVAAVLVLLAGCSGSGGPSGGDPSNSAFPSGTEPPTETTGIIRGVVVDQAIRPIAGVTITLAGTEKTTTTNEDGIFGFGGLLPGTYFLTAHKQGYQDLQASADVAAGVADPEPVRIKMQADVKGLAYFTPYVHDFYIECTSRAVVLCGAPNLVSGFLCDFGFPCLGNITADSFTWDTYFEQNATLIQTELVWESTQAASPELFLQQEALESTCDEAPALVTEAGGPSPMMDRASEEDIQRSGIGGDCPIYYSIFSGEVVPLVGFTVEQRGSAYIHAFYNYLPPEDWRFSSDTDGEPPSPP